MTVVDAAGDEVGRVEYVKMGDPQAVTTIGEEPAGGADTAIGIVPAGGAGAGTSGTGSGSMAGTGTTAGFAANVSDAFGAGLDLPETHRNELVRTGFVKIDAKGWFTGSRYASANQIASVSGDTVTLSVDKASLVRD
jgi:hypothetical protein